MLPSAREAGACWWRGVRDACQWGALGRALALSAPMRARLAQCLALNVGLLGGTHALVHYVLTPLFAHYLLPASAHTPAQRSLMAAVALVVHTAFHLLCVLPLYLVSLSLNGDYYVEMAQHMERLIARPLPPAPPQSVVQRTADGLYSSLLVAAWLLVIALLSYVPVLGPPLCFVYSCWLYSFYCFEYVWAVIRQRMSLEDRVAYFEQHYLYFLGFGTPFTLLLTPVPLVLGLGIYAVLFPLFVAMAQLSQPKRLHVRNVLPARIEMLHEASWFASQALTLVHRLLRPRSQAAR